MMKYTLLILSLFFSVAGFGQGQMFLRATAASGNLLLDDYPGATAAFAVFKLDNDYAGSCIRIRRDSDNTEQDIGFSGNDIDEASINSFCSGANCFVKTWYDQSGNSRNATQLTTTKQPQMYDSVSGIIRDNSVASVYFTNDRLEFLWSGTITAFSAYIVAGIESASAQGARVLSTSVNGNDYSGNYIPILRSVLTNQVMFFDGAGKALTSFTYGAQSLFSTISTGASVSIRVNNGSATTNASAISAAGTTRIAIGNTTSTTNLDAGLTADIQCVIIYTADKTTDDTGIRSSINNQLSIY